jgi:hypothetical protein
VPVQPFYLVNTDRRSTLREFDAMAEIRSAVAERSGEVAARICPSVVLARHDLAPDAEISAQYKRLTARRHLGPQYEWLARMAKQLGLKDLELGIIDGGRGAAVFEGQLHKVEGEPGGPNLALCDEALDSDLGFFKYFRFPVLHLDKKHLQRLSDQRGFIDIIASPREAVRGLSSLHLRPRRRLRLAHPLLSQQPPLSLRLADATIGERPLAGISLWQVSAVEPTKDLQERS